MRDVEEKILIRTLVLENMRLTDYNTLLYHKLTDHPLVLMDQAKLNGYHGYYIIVFIIYLFRFVLIWFIDKQN